VSSDGDGNIDLHLCCILAGGQGRRMGGEVKSLLKLGGKTLLEHVVSRTAPQVGATLINANGDSSRFAFSGLPVIADSIAGFAGPLAGIVAGLEWASAHGIDWVVSFAIDTPFVPPDLVLRLRCACLGHEAASAASGGRLHPVIGLWPTRLAERLRHAVTVEGLRRVDAWTASLSVGVADWPIHPYDPFFNVNRPEDLGQAEAIMSEFSP